MTTEFHLNPTGAVSFLQPLFLLKSLENARTGLLERQADGKSGISPPIPRHFPSLQNE